VHGHQLPGLHSLHLHKSLQQQEQQQHKSSRMKRTLRAALASHEQPWLRQLQAR